MKLKIPKCLLTLIVTLSIVISSSVHVQAYNGFSIGVNYIANVVNVYYYGEPLYAFVCSTGSATPRSGTYYTQSKWRWRGLFGNVFGQYATSITGNILFHSVPYYDTYEWALEWWEYDKLGTSASMGCVRLQVCDAKWIFDNCPLGTPVTFYGSEDPGPWGKPQAYKISDAPEDIRNWDPTDPNPYNAWNYNDDFTKYTFNAQQYLKYNPDLKNTVGTDEFSLRVHWLTTGIREKRRASDEFDLKFYVNYYPELADKFGDDMYSYVEYYNKTGKDAGQIASSDNSAFRYVFDPDYYANKYPDLKSTYGSDANRLWCHFINYGVYENRQSSIFFSLSYYKNNNPEIESEFGNSNYSYFRHFLEQGMKNGLAGSLTFDVMSYKRQYPDLRNAFGDDLAKYYWHYRIHGQFEDRDGTGCDQRLGKVTCYKGTDYSSVYDYDYYVDNNPDIKAAYGDDDIAALKHFVLYGMAEGRQAKSSFDVTSYKAQYPDLRNAYGDDLAKYYWHYRIHGQFEGRDGTGCDTVVGATSVYNGVDYSKVYNYYYYIENYPDVKATYGKDDVATLKYFVENGMSEGHQAIDTFDVFSYKRQYPDLRNAYGDDLAKYYWHYRIHGQFEDRDGTGCDTVVGATTVYNGVDYSKVYDYYYYIESYPDVKATYGNDDVATLKYFVENGMSEGHQAIDTFDVFSYKRQYPDLRNAYGDDLAKYYWHYRIHGQFEGRDGTGCDTVVGATTVYNGVDYSKVYDYYYYIESYPDVKATYGNDDVATLEYFVEYGMSEGHQAIDSFDVLDYKSQNPELEVEFGDDLENYYYHYMELETGE